MSLVNDIVILNVFIPNLVVIGFASAFILMLGKKWLEKKQWLKKFWHPRLILWSLFCALYALIFIALEK